MTDSEGSSMDHTGRLDLGRVGDWTTWTSLLVLLALFPLTFLCLAPFAWAISLFLPGSFPIWIILYFGAFVVTFIPGLEFIQVWLVSRHSRKPTPDEMTRLGPL